MTLAKAVVMVVLLTGIPRPTIDPPLARRIRAAATLQSLLARSRYSSWGLEAFASGPDCSIVSVRADSIILEDSLAGALYWGSPFMAGGIRLRAGQGVFRAVVVADGTGKMWEWGEVHDGDLQRLVPCR